MRRILLLITIVCIAAIACKTKRENFITKYLNANNLPQQDFVINTQKDTLIKTLQGIVVKIAAGSIESSTPSVTLQIKEALTLEDILQAGLTTQTSKGILSSDGMFNIATKEASIIKKPLQIEIPTNVIDENMQLYKGVEEDGNIVWQDPKKLETKPNDAPDGETLFMKNCASCHSIDKALTGPPLAWVENRWQRRENLIEFIQNSQKFMGKYPASKSDTFSSNQMKNYRDWEYALFMYCQYGKSAMNVFETVLNTTEIDAILKYINLKSKAFPQNFGSYFDSCKIYYQSYLDILSKRSLFIEENGKIVETRIAPSADTVDGPPKISPPNYNAEYYKFTITGYGWYNIDKLLDDASNLKSKLSVSIKKTETQKFEVFLVIPSLKILSEGGLLVDGESYGFYGTDGIIYLPQSIDAYVFAVGEEKEKTFFGLERFTTSLNQKIDIKIEQTNKEKFLRRIKRLQLDGLSVGVEKTKNFDNIKTVDKQLDSIQQKMGKKCDCLRAYK